MIPNKDLFVVTSAIKTKIGSISTSDRLEQTLSGLKTLREKVPNSIIVLVETSIEKLEKEVLDELVKYTNINIIFTGDKDLMLLAEQGKKSQAETILLYKSLLTLKSDVRLNKMLHDVKRIYKLSGRTDILDNFNIEEYNSDSLFGKYVFKKRIPSWTPTSQQKSSGADHLYITRMYSFCISLLEDYILKLPVIYENIERHNIDTEHSHYLSLDKDKVIEFDTLGVQGIMGGTGLKEVY
jgi:hypothetical protein